MAGYASPSTAEVEHTHHGPGPRTYVRIFAILFVVTALELAASFLTSIGFPAWVQIITLLILATFKGSLVLMFFMHLRFDSRWFSFLYISGLLLAVLMIVAFLLLFAYRGSLQGGHVV